MNPTWINYQNKQIQEPKQSKVVWACGGITPKPNIPWTPKKMSMGTSQNQQFVNPKIVVLCKSQNQQAHEPKEKVMDEKVETNNPWCREPKKPMGKCRKVQTNNPWTQIASG